MLIPHESIPSIMEALGAMGAKWGGVNNNPEQPTYKGMFRNSVIIIYQDAPISELICLNTQFAPEFYKIIEGLFGPDPEAELTDESESSIT